MSDRESDYLAYGIDQLVADDMGDEAYIQALELKLEVAREALGEVVGHCANAGYGNPIVNERIIDRCDETARQALQEIDND